VKKLVALFAAFAAIAVAALLIFGETSHREQVDCPDAAARNRVVLLEESSSGRDDHIQQSRLDFVRTKLAEAGVCGGPIVVQAWTTRGAIRTLWNTTDLLDVHGGTQQARANRISAAVDSAMHDTIVPRLRDALRTLPPDQSDFLAWGTLAGDALVQFRTRGDSRPTDVYVLSDGVQVDGTINLNRPLSVDEATSLGSTVLTPVNLSGVDVTFIGVGQVAGVPAPAGGSWVDAIRAFAQTTCVATRADCRVLSTSISDSH
jgi:hypothetical protein